MSSAEEQRTRLIGEIVGLLKERGVPEDCRAAGLTLIGWLARRMPGEVAHAAGVCEMEERMARALAKAVARGCVDPVTEGDAASDEPPPSGSRRSRSDRSR